MEKMFLSVITATWLIWALISFKAVVCIANYCHFIFIMLYKRSIIFQFTEVNIFNGSVIFLMSDGLNDLEWTYKFVSPTHTNDMQVNLFLNRYRSNKKSWYHFFETWSDLQKKFCLHIDNTCTLTLKNQSLKTTLFYQIAYHPTYTIFGWRFSGFNLQFKYSARVIW